MPDPTGPAFGAGPNEHGGSGALQTESCDHPETVIRLAAVFCTCLVVSGQPYTRTLTQNGTSVRVEVEHVDRSKTSADPLQEFENVLVRIGFDDVATKSPIAGGSPGAWIDRKPDGQQTSVDQCVGKVKRFAEGEHVQPHRARSDRLLRRDHEQRCDADGGGSALRLWRHASARDGLAAWSSGGLGHH